MRQPFKWFVAAATIATPFLPAIGQGTSRPAHGNLRFLGSFRPESVTRITAIARRGGHFVILDDARNRLVFVDSLGRWLATTSSSSGQADRLAVPRGLAIARDGSVLVHDAARERILRYHVKGGRVYKTDLHPIAKAGHALCSLGNDAVVLGRGGADPRAESKPLHLVTNNYGTVESFGEDFGSYGPFAQVALTRGTLLCDSRRNEVIVASRLHGEVRMYSGRGVLQWSHLLRPFRRMEVMEDGDSRVKFDIPEGDVLDEIVSLFALGGDSLAVQVGAKRRGFRHQADFVSVETRFLSRTTGKLYGTESRWPLIVLRHGALVYGFENAPVPEVRAYHIGGQRD